MLKYLIKFINTTKNYMYKSKNANMKEDINLSYLLWRVCTLFTTAERLILTVGSVYFIYNS